MRRDDPGAVHGGDFFLKRIEQGLQGATCILVIPAATASQAQLPFARWAMAPLLVVMALWLLVAIVIAVGQRWGLVGTAAFAKPPSDAADDLAPPKRESPPMAREADDALPPAFETFVAGARVHVVHLPGRGPVRYRIG